MGEYHMNIGLIDVDSHNFPNLALMKISAYHKRAKHHVEFVQNYGEYDLVYKSKVFSFSEEPELNFISKEIIEGGSGHDLAKELPVNIEKQCPDYTLYPQYDFAVGYLTRGCPRNCPFCEVGEKEGYTSHKVGNVSDFYRGQKEIKLLDPNITACKHSKELLVQLISTGATVDFTQGLDVRFLTDDLIDLLLQINIKRIHFAYDRMEHKDLIEKNLKRFKERTNYYRTKISVFILVNYETTLEEDFYRLKIIRDLNFQPYVMIYDKHTLEKGKSIYFRIQRWANLPSLFWKYTNFDDYQKAHYKKIISYNSKPIQ
jgi:hypothetical protein